MPKNKGLGRDIEKSLEIIENLIDSLKNFYNCPIKKGLRSNKLDEDNIKKLIDLIDDSKSKSSALSLALENIKDQVKDIKPQKNSRFDSRNAKTVIANYLKQIE